MSAPSRGHGPKIDKYSRHRRHGVRAHDRGTSWPLEQGEGIDLGNPESWPAYRPKPPARAGGSLGALSGPSWEAPERPRALQPAAACFARGPAWAHRVTGTVPGRAATATTIESYPAAGAEPK